jgi:hypothetical protein
MSRWPARIVCGCFMLAFLLLLWLLVDGAGFLGWG